MRALHVVLCSALVACGGGGSGGGTGDDWDATVEDFRQAICTNACVPTGGQASCLADVKSDLDGARAVLDAAGEAACLHCLDVKASLIAEVAANGCQSTAAQDAEVFAACDLDPAVDFDGDGTADNDDDAACAGAP
jgi:hypothetical protein